jgi:hypothetical protein
MSKQKISGRVVFGFEPEKSQIYWKCPARGCPQIHYFKYTGTVSSGASNTFKMTCTLCKKAYVATEITRTGTTALLVAVFE